MVLVSLVCGEEHGNRSLMIEAAAVAAVKVKSEQTRVSATKCSESLYSASLIQTLNSDSDLANVDLSHDASSVLSRETGNYKQFA